jgi:Calcineurin-like phosphoesterase
MAREPGLSQLVLRGDTKFQNLGRNVRILHLTDLHVGMASQDWLWPTAKKGLTDDLARLLDKVGGLELVVFSGDLSQKANADEYTKLSDVLGKLWALFKSHGTLPCLFPVPGNHDLARPKPMDPTALMMKKWWDSPDVRRAFWENDPKEYRKLIATAFAPYMGWLESLGQGSIPLVQLSHGILPGDVAGEMEFGGITLGLVGLNTAWLQLDEGDYQRKLDADPRQLFALTNSDPDAWCGKHDFNLLITHHPQEWLHPTSLET